MENVFHGNSTWAKHMKTPWRSVVFHGNSVEYSTWNSIESSWNFLVSAYVEFHGKSSMEIPWTFPWNSLEYKTGISKMQDCQLSY